MSICWCDLVVLCVCPYTSAFWKIFILAIVWLVLCWCKVDKRTTQLELIMKGDIIRAKSLDSTNLDEFTHSGDGDENHGCSAEQQGENWTSVQFSETMSVLKKFLKRQYKKCQNCGVVNPKISKPTFGWFHVVKSSFLFTWSIFRN